MMIEEKDIEIIERIVKLTKITHDDTVLMGNLIRKYIDNKMSALCSSCPAQVRFAHTRLKKWYNVNKIT